MDTNEIRERIKSSDVQRDVAWLMAENDRLKAELSAALAEIDRLRTLSHSAGSIMMRCTALAVQIEDTIGEYARMVQK